MKRVLQDIAIQYESVEDTINAIVNGLLAAKGGLSADNIEIATIPMVKDPWKELNPLK